MKKYTSSLLGIVIILLLLPSCTLDKNYLQRAPSFYNQHTLVQTKSNITLIVHPLDRKESEKYFARDLIADGYFPFHLHIENHTNKPLALEPSYITINVVNPARIAKLLRYQTSTHMTYSNVFALLFAWPLIPFVIAPAGYSMYKTNQKITKHIRRNSIGPRDSVHIAPYAVFDKFFFVQEQDFQSRFVIKLCEMHQDHRLLIFEINLDGLR